MWAAIVTPRTAANVPPKVCTNYAATSHHIFSYSMGFGSVVGVVQTEVEMTAHGLFGHTIFVQRCTNEEEKEGTSQEDVNLINVKSECT